MYGIVFNSDSIEQTVQFGLSPAQPFANLAEAFELVARDEENLNSSLRNEEPDAAWGSLSLIEGNSLELRLQYHRGEYLLIVEDGESGSSTSTGVSSLAGAFAFVTYWASDSFQ